MAIDISKHPEDLLAARISEMNPNLPTLTRNEINIRRITPFTVDRWDLAVDKGITEFIAGYPTCRYIQPPNWDSRDYAGFVVRKNLTFSGNSITLKARSDNSFKVFIDGVEVLSGTDYLKSYTTTIQPTAGEHEVLISSYDETGGAGVAFVFDDNGTLVVSDNTWPCTEYTGQDPLFYSGEIYETTAEVDMKIAPSEAFGDFVEFRYPRIPIDKLFGQIDEDTGTVEVEVKYPLDQIQMLSGAIDNFEQIYQNWYRFSHSASGNYPAKEAELNGWSYIAEYDCIQSTQNSGTYVGFISDDFADDYIFSTLVSAQNADDDAININLGAFKQGDIDAREHTLSVCCARGGVNGAFITVYDNYLQSDSKRLITIDSNTTDRPNNGIGWTPWYAHVYARRTGDKIHVWVLMEEIPTVSGKTRDEVLLGLVDDSAALTEADFLARGYKAAVIDLTTQAPRFNRSVRYGYGQYSQSYARFWNIRRPNDNPEVTPELKQYFIDTFGFNMGDNGIEVENLGANKFQISFDNVLYKGDLTMLPY